MTRVLLIPMVLLLAVPVLAGDELESRLQALEARIAKMRSEAQREAEARARLTEQIAALDQQIAACKKADTTALGAAKVLDLQAERDKLQGALRTLRRDVSREERAVELGLSAAEKERRPVDVYGLIDLTRKRDSKARAALTALRDRITAVLGAPVQQQASQLIALGGGRGGLRVINRVVVGGRRIPAPPQGTPRAAKPAAPKKAVAPKEQLKRAEQDLTDQQKRAAELESRIVAMTRKLMELERRVADLKQKVAKPDAG